MSEESSQVEPGVPAKLTNPLSEETRKERVYLLGISAIGITIVFTGLIPKEISTLGIKFAEADRKSLLLIFALVVGYFLFAFASYALSDFAEWVSALRDLTLMRARRRIQRKRAKVQDHLDGLRRQSPEDPDVRAALDELDKEERRIVESYVSVFDPTDPIIFLRFGFEFLVPPVVAVFAIVALLIRAL